MVIKMSESKIVLYPITVPKGKYCWGKNTICQFFDNEGGHESCELGFYEQKYDQKTGYVLKPEQCLNLKDKE